MDKDCIHDLLAAYNSTLTAIVSLNAEVLHYVSVSMPGLLQAIFI